MSETEQSRPAGGEEQQATARLLGLIRELVLEMHPGRGRRLRLTTHSRLDRDLGFDSLSRVELLLRINRAFGIELNESVLTDAETPADLLDAIRTSAPAAALDLPAAPVEPLAPVGELPHGAQTLIDVLQWHAEVHPQRTHVFLYEDAPEPVPISYASLHAAARRTAAGLQALGVRPGENIALMLPTGRDYLTAFYGVLIAGCVPVPIYPPTRPSQIEDHLRRHARMLANAGTPVLITVREARQVARLLRAQVPALRRVVTPSELDGDPASLILHERAAHDTAFLQYTSGSTGDPKGVVLTHAHLLANIRIMGEALEADSERDVFVSWLPLYHDMGLIGAWLGSQYFAVPLVLMSPTAFLSNPARWLRTIHRHRGTLSAAPNFAFELCLRRLEDADLEGLDLADWRVAANGAEPVSPQTVRAFSERFARYGFRREAMMPVYGLAEAAVGVAFPPLDRGPLIDRIQRDRFLLDGEALPVRGDDDALEFVACGHALPGYQLRVVDERGRELPDRHQGRVEFTGPSATEGYFHNDAATQKLHRGEWLDTGDMGYLAGGDLFLTSRVKDLIIRGGRNLHPHELEEAIGQIDGIRAGCVAAFGASDRATATERLVVVAETRETAAERLEMLRTRIRAVSSDVFGVPPDDVALVPPQAVLKTSSGKIRRSAMRELYESNRLGESPASARRQLARVLMTSIAAKLREWRIRGQRFAYAAFVHFWFWLLAPIGWLLVVIAPGRRAPWRVAQGLARFMLKVTAIPLHTDGVDSIPRDRPCVIAVNHMSYLDGLVLTAVLPKQVRYVAKSELQRQAVAGTFLKRLGTIFVERFDWRAGAADAERTTRQLKQGDSLLFFPEGTLTREPGLMPFRLGAFMAACDAGVPVVPVALHGTRSVLRCGSGFPFRHPVRVSVASPIVPTGHGWQAATLLRDAVRSEILGRIDEPDLAPRPA
jgi:1-acyl-sn-glycerol-3-phosphate acyltransferase